MKEIQYGTVSGKVTAVGSLSGRLNGHIRMKATLSLPVRTSGTDTSDATAIAADIRIGKTAYARGAKLTGTMPDQGAFIGEITDRDEQVIIPRGYHDGNGFVGISEEDRRSLIEENIRDGEVILGVLGSYKGTYTYMETQTENITDNVREVTT